MEFLKIFDAYSLRARLFPALIAVAPAIAALALMISWKSFGVSNAVSGIAVLVILFAIADVARTRGRAIEAKIHSEYGGKPSITMFRRSDLTIDDVIKERYRRFLATKLGVATPSAEEERADQRVGDAFYEQCGVWLRHNARDTKKFPLLFSENVIYGFRRNLLGVKWLALAVNVTVVAICFLLLWRNNWAWQNELTNRTVVVLVIAAVHATYVLLYVRKAAVWDAARAYARELLLSCEAFISDPSNPTPPKRTSAPRRRAHGDHTGDQEDRSPL
jgi:hypothetical protein